MQIWLKLSLDYGKRRVAIQAISSCKLALYASELEFQVEFELTLVELMFQPKQMFHMCNIEV